MCVLISLWEIRRAELPLLHVNTLVSFPSSENYFLYLKEEFLLLCVKKKGREEKTKFEVCNFTGRPGVCLASFH